MITDSGDTTTIYENTICHFKSRPMIDQQRRQIMDRMRKERTVIFIIILFLGAAACAVLLFIFYLAVSHLIPAAGR